MKIKFYGTRGGIPVPDRQFMDFGGNTSCVRVTTASGRIGIFELLIPDETLLTAIARGANLQEIREMLVHSGFVTLRADGMAKVAEGLTTAEEVFYVTRT